MEVFKIESIKSNTNFTHCQHFEKLRFTGTEVSNRIQDSEWPFPFLSCAPKITSRWLLAARFFECDTTLNPHSPFSTFPINGPDLLPLAFQLRRRHYDPFRFFFPSPNHKKIKKIKKLAYYYYYYYYKRASLDQNTELCFSLSLYQTSSTFVPLFSVSNKRRTTSTKGSN